MGRKCSECGTSSMEKIDFSTEPEIEYDTKTDGIAFECKKCGLIEFDEKTSEKLKKEMAVAKADKTLKIDRSVWEQVNRFIKVHRTSYPSMKFFAQKAILEKLEKESAN